MKKKVLVLSLAVLSAVSMVACGSKNGGIIDQTDAITTPTAGSVSATAGTNATKSDQTQAATKSTSSQTQAATKSTTAAGNSSYVGTTADCTDFTIKYSSKWSKTSADGAVVAFGYTSSASAQFTPNINIVTEDLSGYGMKFTAEDYVDAVSSQYESTDYIMSEVSKTTFGNETAYEYTLDATISGYDLKFYQVCTVHNDKAYILTFTSSDDDFDAIMTEVKAMAGTFAFKTV